MCEAVRHGRPAFTVDQGHAHRNAYQGRGDRSFFFFLLKGRHAGADCAHTYFRQSEQLTTGIRSPPARNVGKGPRPNIANGGAAALIFFGAKNRCRNSDAWGRHRRRPRSSGRGRLGGKRAVICGLGEHRPDAGTRACPEPNPASSARFHGRTAAAVHPTAPFAPRCRAAASGIDPRARSIHARGRA